MKKVLILAIALISIGTMAQEKGKSERAALSAEQMATMETKRMTLALDLSKDQQTQVQAIQLEKAEMRKSKMEERKAGRKTKAEEKPTADERYAMQTERLDQQIAFKAEMKKILSVEQYERWEKMAKRKGKGKGKKGKEQKNAERKE